MKLRKPEEEEKEADTGVENIDNKLELLKYTSQVSDKRIRENINSDYILAKLKETDKEAIIEMTQNAFLTIRIMKQIEKKYAAQGKILGKEERKKLINIRNRTFDSYMTRIQMTVLLNRNVEKNHLLRILAGVQEEPDETEEVEIEQKEGTLKKLLNKIGKKQSE